MRRKGVDNRGSSLIHVIICVIFIFMLGMLLLTATFLNVRIKQKELKEQDDFYECETAINEITTGIYQAVIESVQKSYIDVLEVYTKDEYQELNPETGKMQPSKSKLINYYYTQCVSAFAKELGLPASGMTESQQLSTKMLGYLVSNLAFVSMEDSTSFSSRTNVNGEIYEKYIVLNSIQVHYQKGERVTSISTDLTIKFPSIDVDSFNEVSTSFEVPFEDYAIVAEGGVTCNDGISNVIGNVYTGGNGMIAANDSTKLFLYGDNYIIKGDLIVKDRARIQVGSLEQKVNLWAQNIMTKATTDLTLSPTTLVLDGISRSSALINGVNCYIKDDMELDAVYSDVSIRGDYVGYGTVAADAPNESGSSILVNGNQSSLSIVGNTLSLGGYAYIGFKQNLLDASNEFVFNADSPEEKALILTGESVGLKNNQLLYLVPDDYMVTESNPISLAEYQSYGASELARINAIVRLDELKAAYNPNITIQPVVYKTMAGGDQVVYFYIEFSDADQAIAFFNTCMVRNTNWDQVGANVFRLKKVDLSGVANLYSVGNVLDYRIDAYNNVRQTKQMTQPWNPELVVDEDGTKVSELSNTYGMLSKVLKKELVEGETIDDVTTPFSFYIDGSRIASNANLKQVGGVNYAYNGLMLNDYTLVEMPESPVDWSTYKAHIIVKDGDYTTTGRERGIILATGDVTIQHDFEGLIFSNGEVVVKNSANITYNENLVKEVLLHSDSDLQAYFKTITSIPGLPGYERENETKVISLEDLITYQNWKKY